MLKIGVIGAGHLGSIHIKLLSQNDGVEFVGIYDTDSAKAKEIANLYHINSFASQEELIQNCDSVIIASPTIYHFEIAQQCLLSGKHTFIEKPITDTYDNALKLIEIAKDKDLILQVGHVERFNPVMSALNNYDINPLFIEGHRLSQFKPRATDVSVIHDLMIHDIDLCLMLIKSPVAKIDANGVSILTQTPDIANARISFENGAVVNLTASRISASPMRKLRIFQKSAYFSLDFAKQELKVFAISDDDLPTNALPALALGSIDVGDVSKQIYMEIPEIPQINAIDQEQRSFINSIINKEPAKVDGMQAAEALRVVEIINNIITQ